MDITKIFEEDSIEKGVIRMENTKIYEEEQTKLETVYDTTNIGNRQKHRDLFNLPVNELHMARRKPDWRKAMYRQMTYLYFDDY